MIETVASTGSTNADFAARLRSGERIGEGSWLRAEVQTAGKGRAGHRWQSLAGNLHCSTVVTLLPGDPPAPTLALVAGLAAHDVLAALLPPAAKLHGTRWLKWPNDLLVGGAKVAGILCERVGDSAVVGIGINVAHAPPVDGRITTSLEKLGVPDITAAQVLDRLQVRFALRLLAWRGEPLAATLAAWEERGHAPGTQLTVRGEGAADLSGAFAGLGGDGALRLALDDGTTRTVHAGDVQQEGEV